MKTHGTTIKLMIIVAVLLIIATTIGAVTQLESASGTRAPICVKTNGQMRMLAGNQTCDSSERLVEWVVGGEVTDIQAGEGLLSTREDGTVQLAIDPANVGNGSTVFAGFNDGPGDLAYLLSGDLPPIAKLDLPAGDYAIFAKLNVETSSSEGSIQRPVRCKLTAGSDFDEAGVVLEHIHSESGNTDGAYRAGLTLQVVHSFNAPGSVVLSAGYAGAIPATVQVRFSNLKIFAVKASHISNVFLSSD